MMAGKPYDAKMSGRWDLKIESKALEKSMKEMTQGNWKFMTSSMMRRKANTVKHQILNHENHDPRNSRHHLIRGIFRSRREKNAPFTCNLICKTTLKSTQQIRGNTLISTNSKNAGIKVCREYDVLQYM